MKRPSIGKTLLFASIPSLCLLGLIFAGYHLGVYLALGPTRTAIDGYLPYEHLSGFNSQEALADIAECFYDPTEAIGGLQQYIWAPFVVPTPFVGTAPMPGGEINAQGFRYPRALKVPKPRKTFRIFIVGGSTAFGSGAPDTFRTIAGYLETELQSLPQFAGILDFEVVTAANPAWASAHERVLIELRLLRFEPDLVLSFSGANDIFWGFRGRDINWMRTQTDDYYWNLTRLSFEMAQRRDLVDPILNDQEAYRPETVAERLRANVVGTANVLRAAGVPYFFVLQPSASVSSKQLSATERRNIDRVERLANTFAFEGMCYKAIRKAFNEPEEGLYFLDLADVFAAVPSNTSVFLDNVHLGDRGNHLIAKALSTELQEYVATQNVPSAEPR